MRVIGYGRINWIWFPNKRLKLKCSPHVSVQKGGRDDSPQPSVISNESLPTVVQPTWSRHFHTCNLLSPLPPGKMESASWCRLLLGGRTPDPPSGIFNYCTLLLLAAAEITGLTGTGKCELGGCGLLVHDHRNRSSWSSTGTAVPDSWREAPAQWTLLTQNLAASRGPVRVSWLRNRHPTGIWSIWARNFPWKSTSKVNCQACVHWGGRLLASRVEDSAAYSWQVTLWPLHESMGVLTGLTFNCMVFWNRVAHVATAYPGHSVFCFGASWASVSCRSRQMLHILCCHLGQRNKWAGKRDVGEMQEATQSQVSANSAARSKVITPLHTLFVYYHVSGEKKVGPKGSGDLFLCLPVGRWTG